MDNIIWITYKGRRIPIKPGMKGKFKKKKEDEALKKVPDAKGQLSEKEIESNPRKAVDYYLKKGEFEKADQLMEDYGLDNEREEFIEGQNYKVQSDYRQHRTDKVFTDKARDQIVAGYDNYDEAIDNFAKENGLTKRQTEEYFELAGNKLGIKHERITGVDDEKEYKLYKQAKENPDSIDPMTENSTDWTNLDKKYNNKYNTELYNKWLKNQGIDKQLTEEEYLKMSKDTTQINKKGLERSIEMEKDNLARRKRDGDSVENISNKTRNIHDMELELQKEQDSLNTLSDYEQYYISQGYTKATALKKAKEMINKRKGK